MISGNDSRNSLGSADQIVSADELKRESPRKFGEIKFAFPDLTYINKCTYFDYQRNKVYLRTNKKAKKVIMNGRRSCRERYKVNKYVECEQARHARSADQCRCGLAVNLTTTRMCSI